MGRIVVTAFVSLDGVIEDPGGAEDYEHGGWSFEFSRGDEGDRFKLAAGHRAHHAERLGARGHLVGQRVVRRIEGEVAPAGEEADERPALRRRVVADRPAQDRMAGLERVEDARQRGRVPRVEPHFAVHTGERAQVMRQRDPDHGSVCASTESTAGRSRTTAVQLSPPFEDA